MLGVSDDHEGWGVVQDTLMHAVQRLGIEGRKTFVQNEDGAACAAAWSSTTGGGEDTCCSQTRTRTAPHASTDGVPSGAGDAGRTVQ